LAVIAATGLLGVGVFAFAQWATQTSENQQLQAGTGPAIQLTTTTSGATVSGDSLTFAAASGFQPTFTTGREQATYTNTSGGAAKEASLSVTGTFGSDPASAALAGGLSVCIAQPVAGNNYVVVFNGLLSDAIAAGGSLNPGADLANGAAVTFDVYVGAGTQMTECASTPTGSTNTHGLDSSAWPEIPATGAGGSGSWGLTMTWQAG
jgi:hypothetical protein